MTATVRVARGRMLATMRWRAWIRQRRRNPDAGISAAVDEWHSRLRLSGGVARRRVERRPDMIGVDGGSVDPGPHYLGSGKPFCSTMAIRRDLRLMLRAATTQCIPMLIGTCGGAGGEPHLKLVVDLVREIAREEGLHFPMAVIHAEQNKADVARWTREGRTRSLAHQPPLDPATIERAERIVG